jgi:hypothetical protein
MVLSMMTLLLLLVLVEEPVAVLRPLHHRWCWRRLVCDGVAEVPDLLELLTTAPLGSCSGWEKVPDLQRAYRPMLKRIQFLAEKGLMSMMVLFIFLLRCIAPL